VFGFWKRGGVECKKGEKSLLTNQLLVYANHNHCRSFQRQFSSYNIVGGKNIGATTLCEHSDSYYNIH